MKVLNSRSELGNCLNARLKNSEHAPRGLDRIEVLKKEINTLLYHRGMAFLKIEVPVLAEASEQAVTPHLGHLQTGAVAVPPPHLGAVTRSADPVSRPLPPQPRLKEATLPAERCVRGGERPQPCLTLYLPPGGHFLCSDLFSLLLWYVLWTVDVAGG